MKNILCYGDSNVRGVIPEKVRGNLVKAYDKNKRWTGILQKLLGDDHNVIEEGMGGRTTMFDEIHCAFSLTKTNYADEVWIVDLSTMHKKILVSVHPDCDHPKKVIIDPNDLQFSPDSKILYFATSAPWINQLKKQGYQFHLVFLWLKNADLAVSRVNERVKNG